MSSSMDGRSFVVIASTASAEASIDGNTATSVDAGGCAGTSRSVNSVMTPSVPSDPTNNLVNDRPATSLNRGPPSRTARAVGEHDLHAEHVVGGHAVLHAAQAARVGRGVAADRAHLERRRVRRVPEAVLGGRLLDLGVEQTGLHDRDRVAPGRCGCRASSPADSTIPPSTAVEPPDRPEPAPRGTTGTCVGRGPPQYGLDVLGAGRAHDRARPPGIRIARPVLAVRRDQVPVGEDRTLGQFGDQFVHPPIIPRETWW